MPWLDRRLKQRLDRRKVQLDALRPLDTLQAAKLGEQLTFEMTYHSNAIEGNTLSQLETFLVLQEGITFKNRPLRDHLEAKDHLDALHFLAEIVEAKEVTLSAVLIRQLHQLVMRETDRQWAGRFRTGDVSIIGASHTPPSPFDVPQDINQMIHSFAEDYSRLHPVESAALLHHRFVAIHPFFDGNGRTARLLMNLVLMRSGYPLSILLKADRRKYYAALNFSK